MGHRDLCDSGVAAESRSGIGSKMNISSADSMLAHDISASQSEAVRSECVGRLNAALHSAGGVVAGVSAVMLSEVKARTAG